MLLLGLDLETGAAANTINEMNWITELGAILYDTDTDQPVQMLDVLIDNRKEIDPEISQYTHITTEMCSKFGITLQGALTLLAPMYNRCDYVVAHNGINFDAPVLMGQVRKAEMTNLFEKRPWIDTLLDIDYPSNCRNANLTYLQAFHGFVFPGHRAIYDVSAMLKILRMYPLEQIIESANSPLVKVKAMVNGYQDLAGRELAKKDKFNWDGDRKIWTRDIRQNKISTLKSKCVEIGTVC